MSRIRSAARAAAVLLATSALPGCATVRGVVSPPRFTAEQTALLRRALPAADSIVADPVFRAVARQMEEEEQIHWTEDKLELIPDGARSRPTAWLLARFEKEGGHRLEELSPERYGGTEITAVTRPCGPYDPVCRPITRVNVEILRADSGVDPERTVHALANTLVHERVHAFGQKHGRSQARAPNRCDAAYVLGDIAETLLRHRAEGAPVVPRQTLCLGLQHRLRARGVVR